MKLNEWTVRWQAEYDSPNVRRSTYEAHRYVLQNHILPRLGYRELSKPLPPPHREWPPG